MAVQDDIIQNIVLAGQQDVIAGFGAIQRAGVTAFESINAAAASSTTVLGGLATAMGGVAAAAGIVSVGMLSWVRSATQGVIAMGNFAEETGTTIDNLSTFSIALGKAGSDTGNLTNAIRRLAVRVETDWGIIQKSSREAADKYIADQLRIKQANLSLEESSRRLADVERTNSLERSRATLSLKEANVNLAEAQIRFRAVIGGELIDPDEIERLNRRKEFLRLQQAIQQQAEAAHRADRQAAEEAAKAAQAAIDVELKRLHLSQARTKSAEDEANSVANLKKFIDDLTAGVDVSGSKVNKTFDNLLRGLIASVGPAVQGLQDFKGSIGDLTNTSPALFSVILKLSDVMKNTHDETLNLALAVAAFGRGVDPTFVHALSGGSEGLLTMIRELKALGLVLDDNQLKVARDFKKALGGFRTDLDLVSKQFALLFAPQFAQVFSALDQALVKSRVGILNFGESIRDGVQPYLDSFVRVITGVPDKAKDDWLIKLIDGFKAFGTVVATTVGVLGQFFRIILVGAEAAALVINKMFGTELTGAQVIGIAVAVGIFATSIRGIIALAAPFAVAIGTIAGALLALSPVLLAVAAGFTITIVGLNAFKNAVKVAKIDEEVKKTKESLTAAGAPPEEVEALTKGLKERLTAAAGIKGPLEEVSGLVKSITESVTGAIEEQIKKSQEEMKKLGTASQDSAAKSSDAWSASTKRTFSDLDKMVAEAIAAQKKLATGAQQASSEVSKAARQGIQILTVPRAGETPELAPGSRIQVRRVPGAPATATAPGVPTAAELPAGPTDEAVKKGQTNADSIQKAWEKALNEIVAKAKTASDDINKALTGQNDKIKADWTRLKNDLVAIFGDFGAAIAKEFEKVRVGFDKMAQAITDRVQVLVKNIKDAFITSEEDIIGPKQQGLFDFLVAAWKSALAEMLAAWSEFVSRLVETMQFAGASAGKGFADAFWPPIRNLIQQFVEAWLAAIKLVQDQIQKLQLPGQPAQPAQPTPTPAPAPAPAPTPTPTPTTRPTYVIPPTTVPVPVIPKPVTPQGDPITPSQPVPVPVPEQIPLPRPKPVIPDPNIFPEPPKTAPADVPETFGQLKLPLVDMRDLLTAVDQLKRALQDAAQASSQLQEQMQQLQPPDATGWSEIATALQDLEQALAGAQQSASDLMLSLSGMGSAAEGLLAAAGAASSLATTLNAAAAAAERLKAATQSGSPPGPGPPIPTSARGGLFRGLSGIDRNLVMLSDFEYVMRPEAVARYGVAFMDMINSMRFPGYRAGGMVLRGLAVGGSTGRGQPNGRALHITIGDETFRDLVAPESTARALERAAVARSASSTGVKPRWRR